ncbi:helix-turn-helix domain-containing protein [Brevibacterium sp. 50QC2O2]|uniref:helix-turn-helix domain-containing protein n=1 Tax=Brevibacterium sp. 50QC2O2 TaxID=2968459 RepID=UPI00211CFFB5|nr:helix-turn-helix transcriptional regulator [Brevibacterium sp. 50QC2O2]MCQ9387260.1 helix-turn-helix domain-containing protein [Brevibacterium sp. 50QC2O2]
MPLKRSVQRQAKEIGEHLRNWRKLQMLKADEVATRAGISRSTLYKVESGDVGVSFGAVVAVADALGQLPHIVGAFDPLGTDLGRLRSNQKLPERVRR